MTTPDLSIIVACYGQPIMMAEQVRTWREYPPELGDRVEFLVIDDHGTPPFDPGPELDPPLPFPDGALEELDLRVYRVREDIPWNQMGARNLGQKEAKAPWRLMIDPDMVLPAQGLQLALDRLSRAKKNQWFKPWLKHAGGGKKFDFGSPNVYFAHRDAFWGCGGYNEDFAGNKGYSDVILHRTLTQLCKVTFWKDVWLHFYGPKQFADAAVNTLSRDLAVNRKKFQQAVNFAARYGWKMYAQGLKNHVRFAWDRIR